MDVSGTPQGSRALKVILQTGLLQPESVANAIGFAGCEDIAQILNTSGRRSVTMTLEIAIRLMLALATSLLEILKDAEIQSGDGGTRIQKKIGHHGGVITIKMLIAREIDRARNGSADPKPKASAQ